MFNITKQKHSNFEFSCNLKIFIFFFYFFFSFHFSNFIHSFSFHFSFINIKTNQVGGTGLIHNLDTDKKLIESLKKPVFIAGGLNPDNVAYAVKYCKPYGVDVNSGCRAVDGSRDKEKVLKFVKNANIID